MSKVIKILLIIVNVTIVVLVIANLQYIPFTFWGIVSALTILIVWVIILAINFCSLIDEFHK